MKVMNILNKIGSCIGQIGIFIDRMFNDTVGESDDVWSEYGGKTNETISLTLGAEEAKWLYQRFQEIGEKVYEVKDIPIDREHILGEFSSDLCDQFEPWHALKCINRNWKSRTGKQLLLECPGVDWLVHEFLRRKHII